MLFCGNSSRWLLDYFFFLFPLILVGICGSYYTFGVEKIDLFSWVESLAVCIIYIHTMTPMLNDSGSEELVMPVRGKTRWNIDRSYFLSEMERYTRLNLRYAITTHLCRMKRWGWSQVGADLISSYVAISLGYNGY